MLAYSGRQVFTNLVLSAKSAFRSLCFILGSTLGTLNYKFFLCFFLASVARELSFQDAYPPDRLAFARTKLGRRVAKLEKKRHLVTSKVAEAIDALLAIYGRELSTTLAAINAKLAETWSHVRIRTTKRIPVLTQRADPGSTILSLVHSVSPYGDVDPSNHLMLSLHGRNPSEQSVGSRLHSIIS